MKSRFCSSTVFPKPEDDTNFCGATLKNDWKTPQTTTPTKAMAKTLPIDPKGFTGREGGVSPGPGGSCFFDSEK